jgi:hypothetical protein
MKPDMSIKNPIQGPGLTAPGVVILQFLFITFIAMIEIFFRNGVGVITGVAIWLSYFGGIKLGRPGTLYPAVVNPPIAFAAAMIVLMPTIGSASLKPTRLAVELFAALASEATFLITGAAVAWVIYLTKKKQGSLTRSA